MRASRLIFAALGGLLIVLLAALYGFHRNNDSGRPAIRMLAYVGYEEPGFLSPLENASGVKIEVDTYTSGQEMYTKFTSAPPHTYDIVVLDAEFGQRLFADNRILALDDDLWKYNDLIGRFRNGSPARSGTSVYAAPARWGSIGLVFNYNKVKPSEVESYQIVYDKKLLGRIGVFDWYLPNMGVMSLALGNSSHPYDLDSKHLSALQTSLLNMRPQVASIQPSPGQVIDDLRSGKVYLAPGIGEWAAADLENDGLPIDWVVPKEGGIMWVEAFAIASDSDHVDVAKTVVRNVMSPQILSLLATRKAYFSQVSRIGAYAFIPDKVKGYLKAKNISDLETLANRLEFRSLPGPKTTEGDWLAVWARFKAGS